MRLKHADLTAAKGWYAGPWNSDLPVAIGYANTGVDEPTTHVQHGVAPGRHRLTAILKAVEYFGWGLIVNLLGDPVKLSPASLG